MFLQNFKNVIFDLDHTLYPLSFKADKGYDERCREFLEKYPHIKCMTAAEFQKMWREKYGYNAEVVKKDTGISINEFMKHVSRIDMSSLQPNPKLNQLLESLKAKKYIFTDNMDEHVQDTFQALQISTKYFDGIFTSAHSGFIFKPDIKAFEIMLGKYNLNPKECVMVEDNLYNLKTAKELGIQTIWITNQEEKHPFCDYKFNDIIPALELLIQHQ